MIEVKKIWLILFFLACQMLLAGKEIIHDTTLINSLLKQSTQMQAINADSCYKLAEKARQLAVKSHYQEGICGAYLRLGSVMMMKGFNDSAQTYIKQALLISQSLKDYTRIASCYILISIIQQDKGEQDSAFASLFAALRYSEKAMDKNLSIQVLISLGDLYYDYHDYLKALQQYQAAESKILVLPPSFHETKNYQGALVHTGIGNVYYAQKLFRLALTHYQKVDSLSQRWGDKITQVRNLNNMALCYSGLNQYTQALLLYQKALEQYQQQQMLYEESNLYFNLAALHEKNNRFDSALHYLNKALVIAKAIEKKEHILACYAKLAEIYATTNQFAQAYSIHVQYAALKDSLITSEKINSIAEMQTKYETEKKEQQIALLDQQTQTRKAQRNFFIAGTVVLFLALLSLGIYYQQKQRLAKTKEKIAKHEIDTLLKTQELKTFNAMVKGQEEERQRIATDLHDRLGSMLATVKLLFSGLETTIDSSQQDNNKQYHTATNLLDEACVEVRRISHNMSTGMVMSFGVIAALKELSESIESSGLITCKVLHYGMDERLDQQTEIGIYRMIQEIIGNVLKHAKATEVIIQLNKIEELLSVTVEDNGIGFDVEAKRKSRGMGLKNLENRATKLGGSLHIESESAKGTIFIIEIPLTLNT